jgi:hypothetical protein
VSGTEPAPVAEHDDESAIRAVEGDVVERLRVEVRNLGERVHEAQAITGADVFTTQTLNHKGL